MDTFFRFLYEFLSQFFNGIIFIFEGFIRGFKSMFNIPEYVNILQEYKQDFTIPEWLCVGLAILITAAILGLIVFLFIFLIRKYIRIRKTLVEQEELTRLEAENNQLERQLELKEQIAQYSLC